MSTKSGGFCCCYCLSVPHSMWDLKFPNQGSNPCPMHWEHGVLTTGPLGKSLSQALMDEWGFHQKQKEGSFMSKDTGWGHLREGETMSISWSLGITNPLLSPKTPQLPVSCVRFCGPGSCSGKCFLSLCSSHHIPQPPILEPSPDIFFSDSQGSDKPPASC